MATCSIASVLAIKRKPGDELYNSTLKIYSDIVQFIFQYENQYAQLYESIQSRQIHLSHEDFQAYTEYFRGLLQDKRRGRFIGLLLHRGSEICEQIGDDRYARLMIFAFAVLKALEFIELSTKMENDSSFNSIIKLSENETSQLRRAAESFIEIQTNNVRWLEEKRIELLQLFQDDFRQPQQAIEHLTSAYDNFRPESKLLEEFMKTADLCAYCGYLKLDSCDTYIGVCCCGNDKATKDWQGIIESSGSRSSQSERIFRELDEAHNLEFDLERQMELDDLRFAIMSISGCRDVRDSRAEFNLKTFLNLMNSTYLRTIKCEHLDAFRAIRLLEMEVDQFEGQFLNYVTRFSQEAHPEIRRFALEFTANEKRVKDVLKGKKKQLLRLIGRHYPDPEGTYDTWCHAASTGREGLVCTPPRPAFFEYVANKFRRLKYK